MVATSAPSTSAAPPSRPRAAKQPTKAVAKKGRSSSNASAAARQAASAHASPPLQFHTDLNNIDIVNNIREVPTSGTFYDEMVDRTMALSISQLTNVCRDVLLIPVNSTLTRPQLQDLTRLGLAEAAQDAQQHPTHLGQYQTVWFNIQEILLSSSDETSKESVNDLLRKSTQVLDERFTFKFSSSLIQYGPPFTYTVPTPATATSAPQAGAAPPPPAPAAAAPAGGDVHLFCLRDNEFVRSFNFQADYLTKGSIVLRNVDCTFGSLKSPSTGSPWLLGAGDQMQPMFLVKINNHELTTADFPQWKKSRQIVSAFDLDLQPWVMEGTNTLAVRNLHGHMESAIAIMVQLRHDSTDDELVELVKKQNPQQGGLSGATNHIRYLLRPSDDAVIADVNLLRLTCPLRGTRIEIPARGTSCDHVDCFDLRNFFTMYRIAEMKRCPLCERQLPLNQLKVCLFVEHLLGEVPAGVEVVHLSDKATWTVPEREPFPDPDTTWGGPEPREAVEDSPPRNRTRAGQEIVVLSDSD